MGKVQKLWRQKGWGVALGTAETDRLCTLRFADDVLLLAASKRQLKNMLGQLVAATREVGLEFQMGKTKVLST